MSNIVSISSKEMVDPESLDELSQSFFISNPFISLPMEYYFAANQQRVEYGRDILNRLEFDCWITKNKLALTKIMGSVPSLSKVFDSGLAIYVSVEVAKMYQAFIAGKTFPSIINNASVSNDFETWALLIGFNRRRLVKPVDGGYHHYWAKLLFAGFSGGRNFDIPLQIA